MTSLLARVGREPVKRSMDYRQLFSYEPLRQEFLDRLDEISDAAGSGGLEGLDGGLNLALAAEVVEQMVEGQWESTPDSAGLEAIILRFGRPVFLVRGGTVQPQDDGFPESKAIASLMVSARGVLDAVIPSVGRIDLHNHRLDWVGTGWMIEPGLVVTNRHVAWEFAMRSGSGYAFRSFAGRQTRAVVDWFREHRRPAESRFRVTEVVWIAADESDLDVALLRVADSGEDGQAPPSAVGLLAQDEILAAAAAAAAGIGGWAAVIGYPAYDSRADRGDQQRIFGGIYGCKRVAPGQLTAVEGRQLIYHDATTLGGNSGSLVVDLGTGKAVALHFSGSPGIRNSAVSAAVLADVVREHAS